MNSFGDNKLLFSPQIPTESNIISHLRDLISSAEKSIDICIFCFTYDSLIDLIVARHKNGIKVRAITSDRKDDPNDQFWRLQQNGIEVRRNNDGLMHNKFIIIDSKIVFQGSGNWTETAFIHNYETFRTEYESKIVMKFNKEFESLWSRYSSNNGLLPEGRPRQRSRTM